MKIGPWEIGLILIVVLLIFGTGKLANVGRDLGRAIRGFKEESKGPDDKKADAESVETTDVKKTTKKST